MLGLDVTGCTVGIVGLGGIGQAFAKRMNAFNVGGIQYCGHKPKPEGNKIKQQLYLAILVLRKHIVHALLLFFQLLPLEHSLYHSTNLWKQVILFCLLAH